MKFAEMPYVRPELEESKEKFSTLIAAFESAATPEAALAVYRELDEFESRLSGMSALCYIRHTLDTTDEFYDAEHKYFNDFAPQLGELNQRMENALLNSPHRAALEAEFGSLLFRNIELSLKTFSPEIVADLQEENRLVSEYQKLMASVKIQFDGEERNLPQMTPYRQDRDPAVRKAATLATTEWFSARSDEFDRLFDQLVKLRTQIARKLGYENYIELGYYRMTRNSYDKDMVAKFRAGVRTHLVPVAGRCKAAQAKRIGVDRISVYDDSFVFPDGNAKPKGTPDELLAQARKMYRELSPKTGEFIDFFLENELIDPISRPGKAVGGYFYAMPAFRSGFIFANFNGTAGDVDVLTHEAGHAFAGYCARDIYPTALQHATYETCEVHSMSMEFFTWPWMEGFFGDQTAKYRYSHLADALTFIPYGTMVDEFQHEVYANPDMTPAERNALWQRLEAAYRPYLDQEGIPFYGEGRRWQMQAHIYQRPFYYIDYCLAQSVALAFWALSQENHASAWEKYLTFVSFAGTKTFVEQVEASKLPSPFAPDSLKLVAETALNWLEKQTI